MEDLKVDAKKQKKEPKKFQFENKSIESFIVGNTFAEAQSDFFMSKEDMKNETIANTIDHFIKLGLFAKK